MIETFARFAQAPGQRFVCCADDDAEGDEYVAHIEHKLNPGAGAGALQTLRNTLGGLAGEFQPFFERFDGAWFDFALTAIADKTNPIRLDSYTFEIRLPLWSGQPPDEQRPHFLRFDLNSPEHDNTVIGKRCHMHIGSDFFSIPSPWMSPLEILDEFVYGLRPSNIPPPS